MIELTIGPNEVPVSLASSDESIPVIQRFFVVTIPRNRGTKGDYEVHCSIKNTGQITGTHSLALYADGDLARTETFTIAPGETYEYVFSWGMAPGGTSGTVWVVGDWGEETPHIRFTVGYATNAEADVDCVGVTATTAVLRYSARSVTNEWRITGVDGRITIEVSGHWSTMWCALTGLLPSHTYDVQIQGLNYGYRTAWTIFTTRSA